MDERDMTCGELLCSEDYNERELLINMILNLSEEEIKRVLGLSGQLLVPQ